MLRQLVQLNNHLVTTLSHATDKYTTAVVDQYVLKRLRFMD